MSLSQEHRQVLDMLAAGKISADEAQRLMEKLGAKDSGRAGGAGSTGAHSAASGAASHGGRGGSSSSASATGVVTAGEPDKAGVLVMGNKSSGSKRPLKFLRVHISCKKGDEVNIKVPLQFVRAGIKLATVLPTDAREKMAENGIDLTKLNSLEGEELMEALRDLSVDVDSSDGDIVRIFCE